MLTTGRLYIITMLYNASRLRTEQYYQIPVASTKRTQARAASMCVRRIRTPDSGAHLDTACACVCAPPLREHQGARGQNLAGAES